MTANMYRVGDYVYFETSSTSPFQIRRIEELNKTASGNVEAKVMCFYRRRDLPSQLIQLADKHQFSMQEVHGKSDRRTGSVPPACRAGCTLNSPLGIARLITISFLCMCSGFINDKRLNKLFTHN